MPKCSFCGEQIKEGRGTKFVRNSGKIEWYCSSKCEKNAEKGKEPRDVKWVEDNV